jgi:transcriptional regulator with XRE-family HTH domain
MEKNMQTVSVTIQDWLKKQRISQGLEQIELAERSGMTSSSIGRIENGRANPTLFAVLRICYGLGFTQIDFMNAIGLKVILPEAQGKRAFDQSVLSIGDIEAFLNFFRRNPLEAKQFLYKVFGWIRFTAGVTPLNLMEQEASEIIGNALTPANHDLTMLPYPQDLDKGSIWEIYISGGVLTLKDVGFYIQRIRQNRALSLRELAKEAKTTHTILWRLEMGAIERIDIADLIAIDQAIGVGSDIFTLCWEAGEFHTGILRNKMSDERRNLPPLGWTSEEFNLATTLSIIERWYYHYQFGNIEWLKELRFLTL